MKASSGRGSQIVARREIPVHVILIRSAAQSIQTSAQVPDDGAGRWRPTIVARFNYERRDLFPRRNAAFGEKIRPSAQIMPFIRNIFEYQKQ